MISKDLVLDEINRLEHNLKIYEKENDKHYIEITKTNIEANKIILKDLKKLEIIENHFDLELERVINKKFGSNLFTQDTCFIFLSSKKHKNIAVSDTITEEEFNKLKEMI